MASPSKHARKESAVLSMPSDYKPKVLFSTSGVTGFQSFVADGDEETDLLIKAVKNEKCNTIQLRQELEKCKELMHPTLADIVQVHSSESYSYVVWRKEVGAPLRVGDRLTPEQVKCVAYKLTRCLVYLHSFGVVCRDLRPSNVVVHTRADGHVSSVKLVDFGMSKALMADERMAVMEDGSAFASAYVRKDLGQLPAPEVLVDLKIDRLVDSWFLGILLFSLSTGHLPFSGESDEELKNAILGGKMDLTSESWLAASAPLDEVITSLLRKDAKRRAPVEMVLWSDYIGKMPLASLHSLAVSRWLRFARLTLDSEAFVWILRFAANCLDSSHLDCASPHTCKKQPATASFLDGSRSRLSERVQTSSDARRVLHCAKLFESESIERPLAVCKCYATVVSNVWLSSDSRPVTLEFTLEHVREEVFVGVISREFEEDIMEDATDWSDHHLGCDDMSVGVSLRSNKAFHANQEICSVSRAAPSFARAASQQLYLQKFSICNTLDLFPASSHQSSEDSGDDHFDFQFEKAIMATPAEAPGHCRPLRNAKVQMRIDCDSHTLCVKVNDEMLEPVYFEFPGAYAVSGAVTLCSCMDQVTLDRITIDAVS